MKAPRSGCSAQSLSMLRSPGTRALADRRKVLLVLTRPSAPAAPSGFGAVAASSAVSRPSVPRPGAAPLALVARSPLSPGVSPAVPRSCVDAMIACAQRVASTAERALNCVLACKVTATALAIGDGEAWPQTCSTRQ